MMRLVTYASGGIGAAGASSSAGASPVITAVIAAVGTILTALLASWAATRRARRRQVDPWAAEITARLVSDLRQRAEKAEARAVAAESRTGELEITVVKLHKNPDPV